MCASSLRHEEILDEDTGASLSPKEYRILSNDTSYDESPEVGSLMWTFPFGQTFTYVKDELCVSTRCVLQTTHCLTSLHSLFLITFWST